MTISSTDRIAGPFTGTGVQVLFPFTFKVFLISDLLVYLTNTALGSTTALVNGTDYSVMLNANQNASPGGSVTLVAAPSAAYTVTVTSQIANTQPADLTNAGNFYPQTVNDSFDRSTIQIQQLQTVVNNALRLPLTVPGSTSAQLPFPVKNTLIGWDASGQLLINYTPVTAIPANAKITLDNFSLLASTPAVLDQVVDVSANVTGTTTGGGPFKAVTQGALVANSTTISASATSGLYWQMIDYSSYLPLIRPSLNTNSTYGNIIAGNNPIGNAGNDWPNAVSLKDAYNVSRSLTGEQSNYHGFADKTVMNAMLDGGGYSGFDSTVTLRGANHQNHCHSFQDRNIFSLASPGIIDLSCGFYSAPVFNNSGTLSERRGASVLDITKSNGAVVTNNTGYYAEDMVGGVVNVSYLSKQTTDYAWYAPNGGKGYHKGKFGVGVDPTAFGFILPFTGLGGGSPLGFLDTDITNGASLGAFGDNKISFVNNSGIRWVVENSAGAYSFHPFVDNTQSIGTAAKRASVVYAGTGAINTSDERHKEQINSIDDACLRAWGKVEYVQYKFKDAVEQKADGARWHFGVIAQRVKEAFESEGLDAVAYGILCHDHWPDTFAEVQTNIDELVKEIYHEDVPIYEEVEQLQEVRKEIDGVLRIVTESVMVTADTGRTTSIEKFRMVPAEPIFEKVQTQWSGDRYGIRYDEALVLECAYLRSKLEQLHNSLNG